MLIAMGLSCCVNAMHVPRERRYREPLELIKEKILFCDPKSAPKIDCMLLILDESSYSNDALRCSANLLDHMANKFEGTQEWSVNRDIKIWLERIVSDMRQESTL
jgi:hypothetical protein